jgi:hypothetical protein
MSNSKAVMEELLDKSIAALENEQSDIRPGDSESRPGGLILLKQDLPTVVVPDLHGRSDFLPALMHYQHKEEKIFDLLKEGRIQIVCVGDGMHSEKRGRARWKIALEEYKKGFADCPAMAEEMTENFHTMAMVMKLKAAFPTLFHFLKGNHENIMDEKINGNHPFAKLAAEGPMTRLYVEKFYGTDFLEKFDRFEKDLPLMVRGRFFIIAHARPKAHYQINEIINYRNHPEVVEGLTWTREANAGKGIIPIMLDEIIGNELEQRFWICGHTAIDDLYNHRMEEHLLEIHNPGLRTIVVLDPNQWFDPDEQIHTLPRQAAGEDSATMGFD